jgi:hypothetical protein
MREQAPPQGVHVLTTATTVGREVTSCFLLFKPSCQAHVCVRAFLSLCHSYPILLHGLLVSPRSQQELHSCGVTSVRGQNESSDAILLYIEAHTP